ncbi:glutamine amidotransferase [Jannaschia ovalis]|uniref:Glutamine amidotransferase n=1 Tax=Jannaschia ovalis TaxID=3038773 RepID=A0ABY8LG38_9RHOB|nr:glutamine amidotransferase [Jannaschia sp. GRR-S6-38]WGH79607.1 glutamine amidotransferase [Jannaschia sp. GRR-S6-38]
MTKLLLVGESWVSSASHFKGFDQFGSVTFHTGADRFVDGMGRAGIEVTYMKAHEAAEGFPYRQEDLDAYDVLMLSDIGANTLLLPPDVWLRGERVPNRLTMIEAWVKGGGGLIMIGGYMTFQGIDGRGRWHRTPVERALPVTCLPHDDRVEIPEGAVPEVVDARHPILAGVPSDWPYLLGVNELTPKAEDTDVVLRLPEAQGGLPLLVTGAHGEGRTLAWASDMSEHWLPKPFLDWPGYDALFGNMVKWAARSL